ncbi:MAG TPA: carboxypeptidase regulatory-like domain-containing protein, partial [Candidatus Acidoferrales bacterium]|nr:carboxypeptidase regulatory-like domain-containing protein [Candidatus Acidoferrales bacterium]
MNFPRVKKYLCAALVLSSAFLFAAAGALAQGATGTIRGTVTDPSGAAVTGASVIVTTADGQSFGATTTKLGAFEVKDLAPGVYKVEAVAKGFELFEKDGVEVKPGQSLTFDIPLKIEVQKEKVTVSAEAPTVDVSPENNAGAVVISGKALDALSDDPDELQADLQALAGPSAGPNGGQMYIDGFTAGQLPPKSSIREIRINQNPFSSEYDKLGYGRIEIFTKPGTDKFHGEAELMGNTAGINSRNPFIPANQTPSYNKLMYNGSVGGPLSKKASFFVSAFRRDFNDLAIVNAPAVLDTNNNLVNNFSETVPNDATRTNISPRIDYQLSPNNTFTGRYQYWRNVENNNGVGGFSLPTLGTNDIEQEHQLQLSDTQMIGTKVVNETRFQYVHNTEVQTPASTAFAVNVQGAFSGGGNSGGNSSDAQDRYELQNYTSWVLGNHFLKFGARLRDTQDSNYATSGFNGSYTFASIAQYQAAQQAIAAGTAVPVADYPTQFSLSALTPTGSATQSVNQFDAGLY